MLIMIKTVIIECEDEELDEGNQTSCKEYGEHYCKKGLIKPTAWTNVEGMNLQGKCCACGKMGKSM